MQDFLLLQYTIVCAPFSFYSKQNINFEYLLTTHLKLFKFNESINKSVKING